MTDEPPSLVDEWVAEHKPEYPIVCLKDGKFEDFLGVKFFPTAAVIAPGGTLAYSGSAGSVNGPLGKAMGKAKKGPIFPKVFGKVTKLMRSEDYAKSYAELLKLIAKGKFADNEATVATHLKDYLEGLAATALAEAKAFNDGGQVYHAVQRVQAFAKAKPPFPATADIVALIEDMEKNPNFKKELAGGKKFVEAEELEKASEFADAFKVYKSVSKKFDGTEIGALALTRAKAIADGGKAGWKMTCEVCRRHKKQKACAKHSEKVKL